MLVSRRVLNDQHELTPEKDGRSAENSQGRFMFFLGKNRDL